MRIFTNAVIVAMNFTSMAENGPLPTDQIPSNQTYFVHSIAPFASRLVGQVMTCPASSSSNSSGSDPYIRWILNEGVVPLSGVSGCPDLFSFSGSEDEFVPESFGLCPLETFMQAMNQRLSEVDFDFGCNGNYTIPPIGAGGIVDGQPFLSERPPVP